jgi:low affinity Fe/Cu permease
MGQATQAAMTRRDEHAEKPPVSTVVHRIGDLVGHEHAVPVASAAVAIWLVAWLAAGRPDWLLQVFEIAAASITVVMVFVLQHAQNRLEQATQLKLDEIIAALPDADNGMIKAEAAPDEELHTRTERSLQRRRQTRSAG